MFLVLGLNTSKRTRGSCSFLLKIIITYQFLWVFLVYKDPILGSGQVLWKSALINDMLFFSIIAGGLNR